MRIITIGAVIGILFLISVIDLKVQMIPDQLNMLLLITGIWSGFVFQDITFQGRVLGIFCVSLPMIVMTVLCSGGLGGGDIKLMAASGMLLGVKWNIFAACIGMTFGGIYGLFLLLTRRARRKDCFALGPFLCLGIGVMFLITI